MPFRFSILQLVAAASSALLGPAAAAEPPGAADFTTRCAVCHTTQAAVNKVGPSLAGVYGRTSGSAPGYTYSAALKNAKLVWNQQTLDRYLQNPNSVAPGTKMFVNVPDAATRQRIIAYLQSLSPQPADGK